MSEAGLTYQVDSTVLRIVADPRSAGSLSKARASVDPRVMKRIEEALATPVSVKFDQQSMSEALAYLAQAVKLQIK